MRQQLRQGDVFLMPATRPDGRLTEEGAEGGRVILAHGEATGHVHAVSSARARAWRTADERCFLEVRRSIGLGAQLLHDEHFPVALDEGWYEIVRQREYVPAALPRTVTD